MQNRQTACFNLPTSLVERMNAEAKRTNSTVDYIVERALSSAFEERPNLDTMQAMDEAKRPDSLELLPDGSLADYIATL